MTHSLDNTVALLERTPGALDALLRGLPERWTNHNEGEGTFTVADVLGHLIYADKADWMPRVQKILARRASQTKDELPVFDPFDRWGHLEECRGKTLTELLDEFAAVRATRLHELRALKLQPEQLVFRGRHPALGAVSLSELLATWAAHDLTHLHQISRIMARQYGEEVGPFQAFLGVLKCDGHGG
jgi:DinB superfamily